MVTGVDVPRRALAERLERPRYEVLPLDGIVDKVTEHVPVEARVTVTASPSRGIETTVGVAERLAEHGYTVVPHMSARLVRDRSHLEELSARLLAAGVREIFVPAGDTAEPAGEFTGAADLLRALGDLRGKFAAIGITGYPESHHIISDEETIEAMFVKAPMATSIVSQICFDVAVIEDWIGRVRARGIDLPVWIGLPGIVDYARLVRISMKIGLGESVRFLSHNRSSLRSLVTHRFEPGRMMRDLGPCVADPAARVAGFHFYTFNEVERTERWRRATLARLSEPA